MAVKIVFANNKGGSAKTTTAVNVAGAYALRNPNKKILVVETDGQGNATRSFGKNAKRYNNTMYDVFMGNLPAEECIINGFENIDIIPANNDMNFVEFDEMKRYEETNDRSMFKLIKKTSREKIEEMTYADFKQLKSEQGLITENYFHMLDGKLDEVDKMYDLIIFDTPPEIKAITSSILSIADQVIVPFEPDTYSVDGMISILSRIETIQETNTKLEIGGVLAVKVRINTNLHKDVMDRMSKYCEKNGINYFKTYIPNSIRFASSTSYKGLPATITQKDNSFVESYYDLLDEIIKDKIL